MQKRTVKVNQQHLKDVQQLLTLMGVPWYTAPGEAEAQASRMCAQGIVSINYEFNVTMTVLYHVLNVNQVLFMEQVQRIWMH